MAAPVQPLEYSNVAGVLTTQHCRFVALSASNEEAIFKVMTEDWVLR